MIVPRFYHSEARSRRYAAARRLLVLAAITAYVAFRIGTYYTR